MRRIIGRSFMQTVSVWRWGECSWEEQAFQKRGDASLVEERREQQHNCVFYYMHVKVLSLLLLRGMCAHHLRVWFYFCRESCLSSHLFSHRRIAISQRTSNNRHLFLIFSGRKKSMENIFILTRSQVCCVMRLLWDLSGKICLVWCMSSFLPEILLSVFS